jgi:hypothetical protein
MGPEGADRLKVSEIAQSPPCDYLEVTGHDLCAGGSPVRHMLLYCTYGLPGSWDENWGYELIWDSMAAIRPRVCVSSTLRTGTRSARWPKPKRADVPRYPAEAEVWTGNRPPDSEFLTPIFGRGNHRVVRTGANLELKGSEPRASPLPVLISVVGSCRDVALAGLLEPKLFAAQCAGVYLNAGSGTSDRAKAAHLEYNVSLDPASYAAIFNLPCPVYWLPCFEVAPGEGQPFAGGEFGTYYRFLQKDVLERLSPRLQNYFAFMFKQGDSDRAQQTEADALRPNGLRTLEGPVDMALLDRQGSRFRNMWCTAGFLHMAGLSTAGNGGPIEGGAEARNHAVYTFDPVRIRVGADGISEWSPDPRSRNRYLFHVRDPERYPAAITAALGTLLSTLK